MFSKEQATVAGIRLLQLQIRQVPDNLRGQLSDGYHTFDELYEHRITLYITLAKLLVLVGCGSLMLADVTPVWRTKVHSDGSVWNGWFILGIHTEPGKQITYHLPESRWDDCSFATTLDKAPEWDGHTAADVLKRLKTIL